MILYLISGALGSVFFILFLFWIFLHITDRKPRRKRKHYLLTNEEFHYGGQKRTGVLKGVRPDYAVSRNFKVNCRDIFATYQRVDEMVSKKCRLPSSAEWLLDNYYMIEEQSIVICNNLNRKTLSMLPVIKDGWDKGRARIFVIADKLLKNTEHLLDEKTIADFLLKHQENEVLFERELWLFPVALKTAIIGSIRNYCRSIDETVFQLKRADDLFEKWKSSREETSLEIKSLFIQNLNTKEKANSSFVEHLLFRLRRTNKRYPEILQIVEECLSEYGWSAEKTAQYEHNRQSIKKIQMGNSIMNLGFLGSLDWEECIRSVSGIDKALMDDPAGVYRKMDISSQKHYKEKVQEFASGFDRTELDVAAGVVSLASAADGINAKQQYDSAAGLRKTHVGYYLVDDGAAELKKAFDQRKHGKVDLHKKHGVLYFGAITAITAVITAAAAVYAFFAAAVLPGLFAFIAALAVFIPASEMAIHLINKLCSSMVKPAKIVRLELKDGVPEELSTVIAVPALISDEKRTEELLSNLESHYLATRENNIYYALIASCKDAGSESLPDDRKVIDSVLSGIERLNGKYADNGKNKFYFFYRPRKYNKQNSIWTGWERKRGAILEFNDLVLHNDDSGFTVMSDGHPPFASVKYVITLDSDTILPIGMAKKMIGSMAHPLNRPAVDAKKNIVTKGYGIMQPRIEIECESAGRSLFSKLFTGQDGIDPYSGAVSNVYQDLFAKGIYTGKGIYDVEIFQRVLRNSFPENAILSHDLLEGSFVRTALVSELTLVDSHPSKINSYMERLHRWVRGDWQLFSYVFSRKQKKQGSRKYLPALSRWEMADNLRHSFAAPSLLVLFVLSFLVLPGSLFFWLGLFVLVSFFPFLVCCISKLKSIFKGRRTRRHIPVFCGIKASFFRSLFNLIVLPFQAFLMVHAVFLTIVRLITKKNLLSWVTSADAERKNKNTLMCYVPLMLPSLLFLAVMLGLTVFLRPLFYVYWFIPFFALWAGSPFLSWFFSKNISKNKAAAGKCKSRVESKMCGRDCLRATARKTWRYFEEFANERNHYLAPDNYQEEPYKGIAPRTSPTNVGLGLLASVSANDLGYISFNQMLERLDRTLTTVEKMKKWNGHLYNWYDTHTLKPLVPKYVSTVDSGNFAGYLITLEQALIQSANKPFACKAFFNGLRDTLVLAGQGGIDAYAAIIKSLPKTEALKLSGNDEPDILTWNRIFDAFYDYDYSYLKNTVWKHKVNDMLHVQNAENCRFITFLRDAQRRYGAISQEEQTDFAVLFDRLLKLFSGTVTMGDFNDRVQKALALIDHTTDGAKECGQALYPESIAILNALKNKLELAMLENSKSISNASALAVRVHKLARDIKFSPLYDDKRKLFFIGYNVQDQVSAKSYYDLMASEARQASYIAVARGEVNKEHWAKLRRVLTVKNGYKGLVSWTGTMFEYLMPQLIMRNYENTLLDETCSFALRSQIKYGKMKQMPWGVSECSFNVLDKQNVYQYKAIGVPWLGLKRGLSEDSVVSPYSSFLCLQVNAKAAQKNIMKMKAEGLDGTYGFYEAADYTPERRLFDGKKSVVKSYMAHHQGMILLSIDNYLNDNVMQRRFHSDPEIHAARLLLQERVPSSLIIKEYRRKRLVTHKETFAGAAPVIREMKGIRPVPVPHILTNGKYSVLITDRGTGYSKNKSIAVTRWRDQFPQPYGIFFYLRDTSGGHVWSATYAPLNREPEKYQTVFRLEKATFKRTDKDFITKTEVIVASGDNVEIRRITLKNLTGETRTVEITGYFEVVIAPQDSDEAHPAFSNLFVKTTYLPGKKCLLAQRRPRSAYESTLNLACVIVSDGKGELTGVQYETDRMQFTGRAKSTVNVDIPEGKPLTGTAGAVLDPVICLRAFITVLPGRERSVSFVNIVNRNEENLMALVNKYRHFESIHNAFETCNERSAIERSYLNLTNEQLYRYQDILSHIVFGSQTRRRYEKIIMQSNQGQSSLWQYGISGDLPITLLVLSEVSQTDMLYDMLSMHEYFRLLDIETDLVILLEEEPGYMQPLHHHVVDSINAGQSNENMRYRGNIFVLDKNNLTAESECFLYSAASLILRGDAGTVDEQIKITARQYPQKEKRFSAQPDGYQNPPPKAKGRIYDNGIGGFSEDGKEYIIRLNNAQNTPAPWINVVANPRFGFLASELGSGYTFKDNSRQYKLTPWSNDIVSDPPGEVFYIRDDETGALFSPTALPVRGDETYVTRHGYGYTKYQHNSNGTEQSLLQFVPVSDTVKLSRIALKNTAGHTRSFTLSYYFQPVLGVDAASSAMHLVSEMTEPEILLIKNPYNEEFPGEVCFAACSEKIASFTCDATEFFDGGDLTSPKALLRESMSGSTGLELFPCAALSVNVMLDAKEEKEVMFLLGSARGEDESLTLCEKYRHTAKAGESLEQVKNFWDGMTSAITVNTPEASFDLMLNGRLLYQTVACRLWARSAYYQAGGAFGFRDQLQDALALAAIKPETTREQILRHAARQFAEGDVLHWWHEPSGAGIRTKFSDDLLWLPYVTAEYIRISGDYEILNEKIPFIEGEPLAGDEDEKYIKPAVSNKSASLYRHCIKAIDRSLKTGRHGLPLMGSGDWNDGMNTVGNKGKGESVWLGWFLTDILEKFIPLCKNKKDADSAAKYRAVRKELIGAIESEAWDGGWYKRAFFDDGTPLGSAVNKECMIDSISQSWAVISGAGDKERAAAAIKSAEDYLLKKKEGIFALLTPPFDKGELEPGYIKGYVPGVRENGGQYTHAAAWMIIALTKLGEGKKAMELFGLINPIEHTGNFRDYTKYKTEPYAVAADVYAVYPHEGRGGWTWYTGAAGWLYRAGVEYILGFSKNGDKVVIDPCIPNHWPEFLIKYNYNETVYRIITVNPAGVERGVVTISVDGVVYHKNSFSLSNDKKEHLVIVTMG